MKKMRMNFGGYFKGAWVFLVANVLALGHMLAQSPPPPTRPPSGGDPPCWPPPCIPVDNGIIFMIVGAILLGAILLYRKHKLSLEQK